MGFLRKASYKDIIGRNKENQFHYYDNLPARYKEFELYLTQEDLNVLCEKKDKSFDELIEALQKNGAVISAIHCPESLFRTCNEAENEKSSNYLSLCEIIRHDASKEVFKKLIKLADAICQAQNQENNGIEYKEDEEETDSAKGKQIIVIIHEGCDKGCLKERQAGDCEVKDIVSRIHNCLSDVKVKSTIQIALENITPFYACSGTLIETGANCGWNPANQISKKEFFESVNKELKDKDIQFGACVDFCHIMVSEKIVPRNLKMADVLDSYFEAIDYKEYILLFHVSNYGADLSHGRLFSFENDNEILEKIRELCKVYGNGKPITFEMADGADEKKATLNYEHMLYYFSNKHLFGKFGELLNAEENRDLKDFFDKLFCVYSYDKKKVFEIRDALWNVKQIVLKNTFIQDAKEQDAKERNAKERIFGFDFDETEMNLSLARLKAYVYYTRFCNLGNFLADNYYSGDDCIWDKETDAQHIAKDFGLAMKYFMFNDKIHQCEYTGIQYKFMIDFLPKKVNFVRFNDGIEQTCELKVDQKTGIKEVVGKILNHINGAWVDGRPGRANFYSVGKNFAQCLFKYFDPSRNDRSGWSLKMYKNQPINYVEYDGTRYSVQAFTQLLLQKRLEGKINLSLDISRFATGRDGLDTFFKEFVSCSISKEKVASISDEEILFTELPECEACYTLTKEEGAILKVILVDSNWKKRENKRCQLKYTGDAKLEAAIKEINESRNESCIWKILDEIKNNYDLSKINKEKLEELSAYSGSGQWMYNNTYKDKIECVWEGKSNGGHQ